MTPHAVGMEMKVRTAPQNETRDLAQLQNSGTAQSSSGVKRGAERDLDVEDEEPSTKVESSWSMVFSRGFRLHGLVLERHRGCRRS